MCKRLLIMIFLFIFSTSVAYAAQCPLWSDWLERQKPQKDQPQVWQLTSTARNYGWRVTDSYSGNTFNTDTSKNHYITKIDPGVDLEVVIDYQGWYGDDANVYCVYRLGGFQPIMVSVAVSAMYDIKRKSDGTIETDASFGHDGNVYPTYKCTTDARHPQNCSWHWQHGEWSKIDE